MLAITTNYLCNEFLDDADRAVYEDMRRRSPRRYAVAGLGEWGIEEGLVFERWRVEAFDRAALPDTCHHIFGLDYGYANDPTAFIAAAADAAGQRLYIYDEHYEKRMLNSDIAPLPGDKPSPDEQRQREFYNFLHYDGSRMPSATDTERYDEELVAFVDGTMWNALQNSGEVSRHMEVTAFKKGGVNTEVRSLNGTAVLPVPDSRMKTAYEFHNGVDDAQKEGGFVPASNAQSIGLLVLPKRAASLVKKTEQVRTFDPAHNL